MAEGQEDDDDVEQALSSNKKIITIMSAKKMDIQTFFGKCRCCLSYGYLKNMWTEHQFEGEAEIYGEMLVQCFAMAWEVTEDSMDQDQICEQCISRLRDAHDFKKVILDSQEQLVQQIDDDNKNIIKEERLEVDFLEEHSDMGEETADTMNDDIEYTMDTADSPSVKDETEYEEIEYLEDDDNAGVNETVDTDSSHATDPWKQARRKKQPREPIPEGDGDTPKRKWPKKLPKSERLKTYKQYSEVDLRKCIEEIKNNVMTISEASLKYDIPKKTIGAKIRKEAQNAQRDKKATEIEKHKDLSNDPKTLRITFTAHAEDGNDVTSVQKNKNLVANFKTTVRSLLECTNATPIRGYWGIGYACTYCNYQSASTIELKHHTLTAHSKNDNELDNLKYVSDMIIKLDVTALKCKICNIKIDSLSEIMNHIKTSHRKPIHIGISNHIVPFNFGREGLTCALCPEQFNYFKHLSEHMTKHFPNYACKECSRFFINKRSLRTHTIRHMTGTFVCSFCPKIFDTRIKMKEHERVLHLKGSKTRKCGYCDERFMDSLRKTEHEVKEHGAPVRKYACKECGKCFDSQRSVKNHMNQFHLQLRPHKCTECGKGFYSKNEMKRHMVKHTKIKEFQCSVCSKFYVSRGSLKNHMKIHDSEKSYSCESCGETFAQRVVWVQHMTQHACKLG